MLWYFIIILNIYIHVLSYNVTYFLSKTEYLTSKKRNNKYVCETRLYSSGINLLVKTVFFQPESSLTPWETTPAPTFKKA